MSKDKTQKNDIVVGSYIVYAHTLGRSAGLRFGKIVKIDTYESSPRWHVLGVDDDWQHSPSLNSKVGHLIFANRIIVLPFESLPEYAQKLLKDVPCHK